MSYNSLAAEHSRISYIRRIEDALGQRKLYWFGPRGADGRALLAIDQFDGAFSLMAPLNAVSVRHDVSMETLTGQRVDHNMYSFEADTSSAIREFRAALLGVLDHPSAVVPYRPSRFLSNICFPRTDTCRYLGQFHEHQSQFEHKPWVETELKRAGVSTLPWIYLADEERARLVDFLDQHGQIVLRASRSDGGARVELITSREALAHSLPMHDDGFLCACKFYDPAIHLNINGCVFTDGTVLLHGLSEQLIGHPDLTRRRFGYCGNIFRKANDWPPDLVHQFEYNATLTGKWLFSQGYLGVFGIDALYADGRLYVVEVNPRFQGSTWAVADTDRNNDVPDSYLMQIAVFLGLSPPRTPPLTETITEQVAQRLAIVYNLAREPVTMSAQGQIRGVTADLLPANDVKVHPGALTARLLLHETRHLVEADVANFIKQLKGLPVQAAMFSE